MHSFNEWIHSIHSWPLVFYFFFRVVFVSTHLFITITKTNNNNHHTYDMKWRNAQRTFVTHSLSLSLYARDVRARGRRGIRVRARVAMWSARRRPLFVIQSLSSQFVAHIKVGSARAIMFFLSGCFVLSSSFFFVRTSILFYRCRRRRMLLMVLFVISTTSPSVQCNINRAHHLNDMAE